MKAELARTSFASLEPAVALKGVGDAVVVATIGAAVGTGDAMGDAVVFDIEGDVVGLNVVDITEGDVVGLNVVFVVGSDVVGDDEGWVVGDFVIGFSLIAASPYVSIPCILMVNEIVSSCMVYVIAGLPSKVFPGIFIVRLSINHLYMQLSSFTRPVSVTSAVPYIPALTIYGMSLQSMSDWATFPPM